MPGVVPMGGTESRPIAELLLRVIVQIPERPRLFVASFVGAISFRPARVGVLALGVLGTVGQASVTQAAIGLATVLSTAGK